MNNEPNNATEERTTFRVPEQNLESLKERIAKLAKRAAKLHCEPPTLAVGAVEQVECKDEDGYTKIQRYYSVEVKGVAPKINGWEFVAVLQPVADEDGKELGNILRNVPGVTYTIPKEYRAAESRCEHCNTWRRRNETFVLRSDAGVWKQVGRNCLADFLGHASPEQYAKMAEILLSAAELGGLAEDEGWEGGGRVVERFAAEEVLACATVAVRTLGWTSRKVAQEFGKSEATADTVSNWFFAGPNEREKMRDAGINLNATDADKANAAEVVEWLASLSERDLTDNDYLYNLSLLGKGATFTTKNFGLACSAIPTYAKEKEREINRKKKFEADANSQYVGTVGSRARFDNLTLVFTREFESEFGGYGRPSVTFMYKFKDANGNVIVWFSSSDKGLTVGSTMTLEAMVLKHEERDGVKQTKINRAKTPKRTDLTKEEKKDLKQLKKNHKNLNVYRVNNQDGINLVLVLLDAINRIEYGEGVNVL